MFVVFRSRRNETPFCLFHAASELLGAGHALDWTHLMNSMQLNDASSCACSDKTCGCCQQIKIKELHIHSKGRAIVLRKIDLGIESV